MESCMQDLESIDVPAYNYREVEGLCHAEEERLVREGEVWLQACAKESGIEDKDGYVEKLLAAKLGQVACRFWPYSPDPKLTLTFVKIMYWFFIFDNVMDEPCMLGTDTVAAHQFCALVLQAFFTMDASQSLANIAALFTRSSRSLLMPTLSITVLVEWWAELRAGMSARQQARFSSHFADYVQVQAIQVQFREEKEAPAVEEYMRIRLAAGALYLVEMVAERDCGIEIEDEELRNPSMKRLNQVIAHHASLLNDYLGFATEYENGDYFNLLTVLHYRNNVTSKDKDNAIVPFHKACTEAWAIITSIEEECVAYTKAVQEWAKPSLLKYVAALGNLSAVNWFLGTQSHRYNHFAQQSEVEKNLHSTIKCKGPIIRVFLKRPQPLD